MTCSSKYQLLLLHAAHFASCCFTQCHKHCNYLLQSGPLRSREKLQEPYADCAVKASDKCSGKTTHCVDVNPVKLLHFFVYASRCFHVFCSTMGEYTECSKATFIA
ncbi:hypothetical protein ATANTOWER_031453 [Ataeniobius toweri]|uniref:Secreted protein n=1 Tax=Ataeniobius toweri TaxID=208326 RepID=A0ABU7CB01_9TELE|nr:hypothetical protein [Ataeniobius toweri]